MENLFICHSQSHLILATGLSRERFSRDHNDLILFKDFNIREDLIVCLAQVFDSCVYLEGTYPASKNMTFFGRIRWYKKDVEILRKRLTKRYDRVFAVCDWTYPVQYAIKKRIENNPEVEVNWLEDGILPYFTNLKRRKGLDKYGFTMWLRKLFFRYVMGLGKVYDRDFMEMGGLSVFKNAYVSYPEAVREPYKSQRCLMGITTDEFKQGIAGLYQRLDLGIPDDSIILVMDKLDTYLFPDKVQNAISEIIKSMMISNTRVYCKKHPREDKNWEVLNQCHQLDNTVSLESILNSLEDQSKFLRVIGIKSAGLMTAYKMGFKVESLFLRSGETNDELLSFYKKLGILLM